MHAVDLPALGEALTASWGADTSYEGAFDAGNPARGQCYPTARVVQHFFPGFEIARGWVDTGRTVERHFWNVSDEAPRVDLTWEQFPPGSVVQRFEVLDRTAVGDSAPTMVRCELLLQRVLDYLERHGQEPRDQ